MSGLGDQMAEEPGLQDIGEPKGGRTRSLRTPNTNRGPNRPASLPSRSPGSAAILLPMPDVFMIIAKY